MTMTTTMILLYIVARRLNRYMHKQKYNTGILIVLTRSIPRTTGGGLN